ncbi:MAG TPA: MaoC family dehydratase [Bacilli bacterium]|nr:MaoC family dehydratase [Bacilli bacterium]
MRRHNDFQLPKLMKEFTFTLERGKIREFAQAIGLEDKTYSDVEVARQAGHRDVPAPLTFGTVPEMWHGVNFEELIGELGLELLRILHGEQSFHYHKPMYAGDELSGKTYLVHIEEKNDMMFFTFDTAFYDECEELVLSSRSVVIERGENQ